MGDIVIKIPQNTNETFEIVDRELAERILSELKRNSIKKKRPVQKKEKDFSELSALADKWRENPDAETIYAIKTAEKWRKRWDR